MLGKIRFDSSIHGATVVSIVIAFVSAHGELVEWVKR